MTITWPNSRWAASSSLGDRQAAVDLLGVSVPAALEPLAQRLRDGGATNTSTASGIALPDLAGALDLDLQHHAVSALQPGLDLGAKGPVAVAGVGGVLHKLARGDPALELLLGPGSGSRRRPAHPARGGAGGGRHGELEARHPLEQPA